MRIAFFFALFLTFNFTFYIPPAQALQLLPTPGTSCDNLPPGVERDECRANICPRICTKQGLTERCDPNKFEDYKHYYCNFGACLLEKKDATQAQAQAALQEPGTVPCNYTLDDLVLAGINFSNIIFGITGALMLLFIAYGGYQMLTSLGNPEAIKTARGTLTAAFVGFILIIAATIVVRFIGLLLGVNIPGRGALGRIPVCVQGSCPAGMEEFAPRTPSGQRATPCTAGQTYCVPK